VKKALVLVVEKDRALAADAAAALREADFEVVEAVDGAEGLKKIHEMNPDVIIASTDLPPVNGEDACKRIRQASYLPFIVLGTRDEVARLLELGADAGIVKPPSGREMVARVHALLRRKGDDDSGGGPGIDTFLRPDAGPDSLSPTERRLGRCLLTNEGRLLPYPQLISEVWGGRNVGVDTLHFYVRRLRRKLANFKISGVRGIGYGFSGGR
jgi:two-component system response regulator ArlR